MKLYLKQGFKFIHEPLHIGEDCIPFLQNQPGIEKLKERISNSVGGTFLLTGFRGVGKTTLVMRAVEELLAGQSKDELIIPIKLNFARPLDNRQLLFEIIRRLFEALIDFKVLDKIHPNIAQAMTLAYARTSLSIKRSQSQSVEEMISSSWGGKGEKTADGPLATLVNTLLPKLTVSRKRVSALASEASFLAYSDADVEHDFLRIVGLLERGYRIPVSRWSRFLQTLGFKSRMRQIMPKLVVVIDELDKLAEHPEGLNTLDYVLNGMKNILTTSGVCFIFVGGADLHDQWLRDIRKGNSIYESTFAWQYYVPCVWGSARDFLLSILDETLVIDEPVERFIDYLDYKSRGIPRRLIQEFNTFVSWENGKAQIGWESPDFERVNFYAQLQQILSALDSVYKDALPHESSIKQDRERLGSYYIVDWVLGSEGRTFTAKDVLSPDQTLVIDPAIKLTIKYVNRVLQHLVKHKIVKDVSGSPAEKTMIADVPTHQEPVYCLVDDIWQRLVKIVSTSEKERADLNLTQTTSDTAYVSEKILPRNLDDALRDKIKHRFSDLQEVGRGGMGIVYRATDNILRRQVALKFFLYYGENNENASERFMREARVAARLSHPNIVRTFDLIQSGEQPPVLVMEYIKGHTLRELIETKQLEITRAVAYLIQICDAVRYAHSEGVQRLDIKPSNIIVNAKNRPKIVDFGIANLAQDDDQITKTGMLVGTPAYMAPEQILGKRADYRVDIYALGVLLYEALSGSTPWPNKTLMVILQEKTQHDIDITSLNVSDALKTVITKATNRKPDMRYQSAQEMLEALKETPEAEESIEGEVIDSATAFIPSSRIAS